MSHKAKKLYTYAVWFRWVEADRDEDREWVAVVPIEAVSIEAAQRWGDHLAKRRAARDDGDEFLWSEVLPADDPMYANSKPSCSVTVRYGEDATDEEIDC